MASEAYAKAGAGANSRSKIFVGDAKYVFSDLRAWGVTVLILGILALLSTWWLWQGSVFAKWFGILVAGINGLGQLFFVNSSLFWSLAIFACDVLVIYALARYGGETAGEYAE